MKTSIKLIDTFSGLRAITLSNDQTGKTEDSALQPADAENSPYPLVSGKDLYGKDLVVGITLKGVNDTIYIPEAIINVSRERNIVATPVINGKGTVKEMFTDGDLSLTITVAVISTSEEGEYQDRATRSYDNYPYKGVERLRRLLDEPNRLNIASEFLEQFDLDTGDFGIIVKSYSVAQETHTNRQVFSISALSDYDYDLLIEK